MPSDEFEPKSGTNVFSPSDLIQLPRPGSGVANPAGDLAFVQVSQYSFTENKSVKKIHIVALNSTEPAFLPLVLDGGDAFWLDSETLGHIHTPTDSVEQEIRAISLKYTPTPTRSLTSSPPVLIGTLPPNATASNFKYLATSRTLVFSSYVYDDEDLTTIKQQDEEWETRTTTARTFDKLYVRHWDRYVGPKHSSLFTVELRKNGDGWLLGSQYFAPLKGTEHSVPVEPFGGADDFDISDRGIVYTVKDPSVSEATHTRQNVYLLPLKKGSAPRPLTSGQQGATRNPVFSPDGAKVAWLELATDGYESDEALITIYDLLTDVRYSLDFRESARGSRHATRWDRSPSSIVFSPDGKSLYFTAGDQARIKVFVTSLPSTPIATSNSSKIQLLLIVPFPVALTYEHSASGLQPLSPDRLLFTKSSLNGPNNLFVLSGLAHPNEALKVTQVTNFGEDVLKEKNLAPYEEFWFDGADQIKVHGWVVKPGGWTKEDRKATWPVVLLIHGGPQGAWEDQWSTRWNPQVFAQQGYFVIAINPTGSTTFGQAFTDAIASDWGGRPFVDLQKGWAYALEHYPEIDADRAVAAGASWGGYAVNWIAGHQEEYGFDFKALMTHDGIFDTRFGGFVTEELFFFMHDFGGSPMDPETINTAEKFNPANFVNKWHTPHLIIHGSKDYRLPETDGLGAFTALQLRNVRSRFVLFEGENHWVLAPGNSLKWHVEVFGWFDKFVGSRGQPSKD